MTQQRPPMPAAPCTGIIAMKVTLADIEAARRTIAGHVLRTPVLAAPPLSALTGAEVYVKYENLQVTNSFKERGACVKLAALDRRGAPPRRDRHVGRQSRPGGGLSCPAARYSGHHRHAGDDAVREGQGNRSAGRCGRARWRDAQRKPRRAPRRSRRNAIWCGCTRTTIRTSSPARAPLRSKCWRRCRISTFW